MRRANKEKSLHPVQRLLLALVILVIDAAAFIIPVGSLFIAYVILSNPPWVRAFLERLDAPRDE
jgi:hypothetical protein